MRENGQKVGSVEMVAEAKDVMQSPTPATHLRAEIDVPAQGLHRTFDSADKRKGPARPDVEDNIVPVSIYFCTFKTLDIVFFSLFFVINVFVVVFPHHLVLRVVFSNMRRRCWKISAFLTDAYILWHNTVNLR